MKLPVALPLAGVLDSSLEQLAAILIPIALLSLATTIVVSAIYFHNRRREMWHQTARLALEKGQPIPPLPDVEQHERRITTPPREQAANDIRAGLICIGVGAALYLFLGALIGPAFAYIGAIPGFVGIALLLFGFARLFAERKNSTTDDRPPQP